MKTLGIIAEYNPFHKGHAYHIQRAKELSGSDRVIIVMSGDFLERGEPSVMPLDLRCENALQNGADMVVMLPIEYSTGSAGIFAHGGISILKALGADCISFGVEDDNLSLLKKIAETLYIEDESFKSALKEGLKEGLPYPKARENAIITSLNVISEMNPDSAFSINSGIMQNNRTNAEMKDENNYDSQTLSDILHKPNNILAVEYLLAMKRLEYTPSVYPVKREGSDYNSTELSDKNSYSSAIAIRTDMLGAYQLCSGSKQSCSGSDQSYCVSDSTEYDHNKWLNAIPENTTDKTKSEYNKRFPITSDDLSSILHYKLNNINANKLVEISDVDSDLADRIISYKNSFSTFEDLCMKLKNKAYTYSRIKRALIHIILDIKKADVNTPGYIYVLGIKNDFANEYGDLIRKCSLPVISSIKKADSHLTESALESFNKNKNAIDLYNGICAAKFGTEMRNEASSFFLKV